MISIVIGFSLALFLIGYIISRINYFAQKRIFRIIVYVSILILGLLSSVIIFDFYQLKSFTGIIAGCFSFWLYAGTTLYNGKHIKLKFKKFKNVFGIFEIIVGIITLIFFIFRLFTENYGIDYFFLHFYIGLSQVAFGFSLSKSSKNEQTIANIV